MPEQPKFKRILLKISGESLTGEKDFGIDASVLNKFAKEIKKVHEQGIQIAIVIGGGNIFRGLSEKASEMDRVQADYMGMFNKPRLIKQRRTQICTTMQLLKSNILWIGIANFLNRLSRLFSLRYGTSSGVLASNGSRLPKSCLACFHILVQRFNSLLSFRAKPIWTLTSICNVLNTPTSFMIAFISFFP